MLFAVIWRLKWRIKYKLNERKSKISEDACHECAQNYKIETVKIFRQNKETPCAPVTKTKEEWAK
jgi:hypothetical protein